MTFNPGRAERLRVIPGDRGGIVVKNMRFKVPLEPE